MSQSEPPRRWKRDDELTADEHFERQRAARRGLPRPMFQTAEYTARLREVLEAAGLESDHDDSPHADPDPDPEALTADDHLAQIRRNR